MPALALAILIIVAGLSPVAEAQIVMRDRFKNTPCEDAPSGADGIEELNRAYPAYNFNRASNFDSRGRCNHRIRKHGWPTEELYGRASYPQGVIDEAGLAVGNSNGGLYARDREPQGWFKVPIVDHLDLRVGEAMFHGDSGVYLFFHRYGQLLHVAVPVRTPEGKATDQLAVFRFNNPEPLGVVYASDPFVSYRWDERVFARYPFLYGYDYFF